jgi:hypothetical protein
MDHIGRYYIKLTRIFKPKNYVIRGVLAVTARRAAVSTEGREAPESVKNLLEVLCSKWLAL